MQNQSIADDGNDVLSKVPRVTLAFWIVKILAHWRREC